MSTAAKVMLGKKVKVFSMGSYGGADGILLAGTEKIKISISISTQWSHVFYIVPVVVAT